MASQFLNKSNSVQTTSFINNSTKTPCENYMFSRAKNRSSEPAYRTPLVVPLYTPLIEMPNSSNCRLSPFDFNSLHYQEQAVLRSRSNSLQFRGNFQVEETENGIKIQIKQPHLISVRVNSNENKDDNQLSITTENNMNMNKTSIKIYPLKSGRTMIGSCLNNDIHVQGRGIESEHCFIENNQIILNDKMVGGEIESCFIVTIYPLAKLCAVDGVLIDKPFVLTTGKWFCVFYSRIKFSTFKLFEFQKEMSIIYIKDDFYI